MNLSSRLLEDAVTEFNRLPGIGKKTALRLVLHLLKMQEADVDKFGHAFINLRKQIRYCKSCNHISETDLCQVCADPKRDPSLVCVVQDIRDVIAIENTGLYKGHYHVLGGLISPMDGIGPSQLCLDPLFDKVSAGKVEEVLMALNGSMEGDTTIFYLYRKLKEFPLRFSTIARGLGVGDELEYADEITLGRSIQNRIPYENTLVK